MDRIVLHWTAGGSRASSIDKDHYHRLIEGDGTIVDGKHVIESNRVIRRGRYAAHTRGLNTGSIGLGLCGMRGAVERPLSFGPSPLTEVQVDAACVLTARLCEQYGIRIDRKGVLTHGEVQSTYGVAQRGKWDINVLPFLRDLSGAHEVGDWLRDRVIESLRTLRPHLLPMIALGSAEAAVSILNDRLDTGARPTMRFDGVTHAAVMAFQARRGLVQDGVVGPNTWRTVFH